MLGLRKKLLASSLLALPGMAGALGLGSIEVKSALNEPLRAEIQVILSAPEEKDSLRVALASPEDFAKVGLDMSRLAVDVDFKLATNSRGQPVIEVSSNQAVREPFLSLLVEVNWSNGRLLREFSVLLDPPVMASARSSPDASQVLTQPVRDEETASAPALSAEPVVTAPAEPVAEPMPEPAPPPAAEPMPEPAAEPVSEAPSEAISEPVAEPPPEPVAETMSEPAPEPMPEPAPEPMPEPAPEQPVAEAASEPMPEPLPEPSSDVGSSGEFETFGPTEAGTSLFSIARQVRPGANLEQVMVSILRANPDAFYQDNINALKKGVILRIPNEAEMVALDEAQRVALEHNGMWSQYQAQASSTSSLSDSGATSVAAESGSTFSNNERVELVAPREEGQGSGDRPGQGNAGSSEEIRNLRDDLALAREELSSAQSQTRELNSRVSDLEKLKQDQNSLIEMKDDRIAELEARLKELESLASTATTTPPANVETPIEAPAQPDPAQTAVDSGTRPSKIPTEDDIWASEPLPGETTPSESTSTETTPAETTVTASDTASDPTTDPTAATDASASTDTTSEPVEPPASTDSTADPGAEPVAGTSTETTPIQETTPPPAEPIVTPPAVTEPVMEESFLTKWWPYLAGGAGLLGLLGLLVMRKKPIAASEPTEPSVDFGIPAPAPADAFSAPMFDDVSVDPETALRSAVEADPGNLRAHADLLQLFYQRRDASSFEDGAQAMFAQVLDPNSPEWMEVKTMGMDLIPDSALFASPPDFGTLELPPLDEPSLSSKSDEGLGALDFDAFSATPAPAPSIPAPPPMAAAAVEQEAPAFDFDLNLDGPTKQITPVTAPVTAPTPANDDLSFDFSFDLDPPKAAPAPAPVAQAEPSFEAPTLDLPSFDFENIKAPEKVSFEAPDPAPATPSETAFLDGTPEIIREPEVSLDDSLFGGSDDAVGTKLDLARAYLDMGDPDGARGMLEEVIQEGTDQQRRDAQDLLARL
jgi:pilus assembly protein FimV